MKIIEPSARMIGPNEPSGQFMPGDGIRMLKRVEYFGRVSHRSEGLQTEDSWERFIRTVVFGHGDWSITEHQVVSVDATVDRGVTHEWVRHRIAAYTQESTRFVNYAKRNTTTEEYVNPCAFICPPSILATKGQQSAMLGGITPYDAWVRGREWDENEYLGHIQYGIKPQEARTCFPNALAARLIATYNLRMWRLFFLMRTTKEAHPQMRQVTIPLLAEFKGVIPVLFDDIQPEARQVDNLRLPR